MIHVAALAGFGTAPTKPATIFDIAAQLVARAERGRGAGLGAPVTSFEALVAASDARRPASFVSADRTVFCKVPDRAGSYRLECSANSTSPAARAPAQALQRATDALLAMIPLYKLTGQVLEIKLPDGGTQPAPIPSFPANPIRAIGGGYDGRIGSGTMQYAAAAMLIAAALSAPPPSVMPAFASMTPLTFTQAAGEIAAYFAAVTRDFDALLVAYKERGRVPAADPLVPETVVMPPATPAERSNTGILLGLAAAGLVITIGGSYAAARARNKRSVDSTDFIARPAFGGRRRRYRPRGVRRYRLRGGHRGQLGGGAW